jgi:hypothetical protein
LPVAAAVAACFLNDVALTGVAIAGIAAAVAPAEDLCRRLRLPALAAALLVIADLAFRSAPSGGVLRMAALFGACALVATVGAAPFLHPIGRRGGDTRPDDWLLFVAPVLATIIWSRVLPLVQSAAPAFASLLIGFGLLNLFWGVLGGWLSEDEALASRHSVLAEWGLVLVGFGLLTSSGIAAAYLVLLTLLLVRLPLQLWAEDQPAAEGRRPRRLLNLAILAAIAGAAPFAGFTARVLLLRASTQVYWPLAVLLAAGMLLWVPQAVRQGRRLGQLPGRAAAAAAVCLGASLLAGLYPAPLLRFGGL